MNCNAPWQLAGRIPAQSRVKPNRLKVEAGGVRAAADHAFFWAVGFVAQPTMAGRC